MQFLKAFNFFYPHMFLESVAKRIRHEKSRYVIINNLLNAFTLEMFKTVTPVLLVQ